MALAPLLLFGIAEWLAPSTLASPGSLDLTFDPGSGVTDGTVYSIAVQWDGKFLFGGFFSSVNGNHRSGIARLETNSRVDESFSVSELGGHLHPVLALPDGKILIGGEFDRVNAVSRIDVARLNWDGSVDTTFNAGTGPAGNAQAHVDALALLSEGKVIVTGDFSLFNQESRAGVVRLLPSGRLDPTFDAGQGVLGHLPALALDRDGRIVIGGNFTNAQGEVRYGITRLNSDGSRDPTFQPSPGAQRGTARGSVNALAAQPDGKLIIGGDFTHVNGVPCNRIARLNSDGSLDASFFIGSGVEGTLGASVDALALQNDGKILLGGSFAMINGSPRGGLARLNRDGSLDTTFAPGSGVNDRIKVMKALPQGQVLLAGSFTKVNDTLRGRIARLQGDHRPSKPSPVRLTPDSGTSADQFRLRITGNVGGSYTVETSGDLRVWRTVTNFVSADPETVLLDSGATGLSQRFYRVLTPF
ncbi:MAG: delta-60 repeat domain-containing protein [Verrucomicrobia bacterium]|nr:delta-60 repeat domain-containing protein [Verrucomicrobiota bacterium]